MQYNVYRVTVISTAEVKDFYTHKQAVDYIKYLMIPVKYEILLVTDGKFSTLSASASN